MIQDLERSCSDFREIRLFLDKKADSLGVLYISTGVGEFLANVDMNIGINWDFSKKNVNKPLFRLNSMVFLHSQYLSEYEAGREIDTNSFDAKINQVRQKILHLYANRLTGKASKGLSIEPIFIDDLQAKYTEIAHDMATRNGATYTYMKAPSDEAIKNRLVYVGGIYDPELDLYRVIGFMGNYYNFEVFEVVQHKQSRGVK